MKRFLLAGGSGLVGRRLATYLVDKGYSVSILSRKSTSIGKEVNIIQWDGNTIGDWASELSQVDVVVNLCGENLGSQWWTESRKIQLLRSRIQPTEVLVQAIKQLPASQRPSVYIQASGVGVYGAEDGSHLFTEQSSSETGFVCDLATRWEQASLELNSIEPVRRVILRLGVVLDREDGALPKLALPFHMFFGGPSGDGQQYFPWIHQRDVARAIEYLAINDQLRGKFNLCSPTQHRNVEFCRELGKTLNRPSWFPIPAFVLRLFLGEMSSIILTGQRVAPQRLVESGFEFKFGILSEALSDIYN